MKGVLGYTEDAVVSSDFITDERTSSSTQKLVSLLQTSLLGLFLGTITNGRLSDIKYYIANRHRTVAVVGLLTRS